MNPTALRGQRGAIKAACTRIKSYVDAVVGVAPDVIAQVEERRVRLDEYWTQYNDLQDQLEVDDPAEEADRVAFEDAYYALCAKMKCITRHNEGIHGSAAPPSMPTGVSEVSESLSHVRLPKLNLPTFTGKYDDWFPFYDLFNSVIHNNCSLTDTQRFQYLKTSVKGEAADVIDSIELSDQNYAIAWNLLKDRYDNKRVIVNTHIRAIFDLPAMSRENAHELRQIADGTSKHVSSLKSLQRPTDTWDDILIHIVTSKLDSVTAREWQSSLVGAELPTLKQLLQFLIHRCQILEASAKRVIPAPSTVATRATTNNRRTAAAHIATVGVSCAYCNGDHPIYFCRDFGKLSVEQRIADIRRRKLCTNCLRTTKQTSSKCFSSGCKTCKGKHNTLLHLPTARDSDSKTSDSSCAEAAAPAPEQSTVAAHTSVPIEKNYVMLSTALVNVYDNSGSPQQCRALLDCGSQANFVSRRFADMLQLKTRPINLSVSGINQTTTAASHVTQLKLQSRVGLFSATIDCIVTEQITEKLPTTSMRREDIELPRGIKLADPWFHASSSIDLLIGADLFWQLLCVGQVKQSHKHPALHKMQLGWILAGRLGVPPEDAVPKRLQAFHATVSNRELQHGLQRFWDFEDVRPLPRSQSLQEQMCERHFVENVSRDDNGRFIVRLPCRGDVLGTIGDSRATALRRFSSLEKRLNREPPLKAQYVNFIREYIALGHMQLVREEDDKGDRPLFYLPHHCVLKPSSETTKLRVVFDGSCRSSTGVSLNDALLVGPVVQQDLISIIMRFRTFAYVFTADVIKMYRQVLVHPDQTGLQRILWREDAARDIGTYELTTVTYGTSSASFLATRCLTYLAEQEAQNFPIGALHVLRDFYVDDILTGADSISEAKLIRDELISLLAQGAFSLSKWSSNSRCLLEPLHGSNETMIDFNKDCDSRILGIRWNPTSDCFHFVIDGGAHSDERITKRNILSEIAKLFDPLGFVGPAVIISKLIIQELWQLNLHWDESVPVHIHTHWSRFKEQLSALNELRIPRRVKFGIGARHVQIHGFCDASQNAYGACIYLRSRISEGEFRVELLCSKSRVAPLKAVSLPRLELCAALLLAQLLDKVRDSMDISQMRTFLWSDSTITLNWISSSSRRWTVFVANRVGEVQRLTSVVDWHHVCSEQNPADPLSRGVEPAVLADCQIWWHGPSFLRNDENSWPVFPRNLALDDMPEMRIAVVSVATVNDSSIDLLVKKFSSINKICRIIAYCMRVKNCRRDRAVPLSMVVSPIETAAALRAVCKYAQSSAFGREIKLLASGRALDPSSALLPLSPFLSDDGLLRVGGRLRNARLSYDAKHPILLPRKHPVTILIIQSEHIRNLHSGVQATIAAVRQRFWPIAIRCSTRRVIHNCVRCFRAKPVISEAIMRSLPSTRVVPSRPFSQCGVDYAGPMLVRDGKRRNSRITKAYISIFLCFATKAVHIELVSDLTTEAFLGALKRIIARRGQPVAIHSDNGTTFVGASRQLREFYDFLSENNVQLLFLLLKV